MKILLIMPNYGKSGFYHIAVGLMYVSSYLKQKGYDIRCINMNHHKTDELIEMLKQQHFDVVGTGGLFIHFPIIKSLIEIIRQYSPQVKVILGGGIASTDFGFIFDALKPDILIVGEGEITADLLLQAIKNNTDLHKVTGIAFRENGKIMKTAPTPLIKDLDKLPFPDYQGFGYRYYLDNFVPDTEGFDNILDITRRRIGFVISSRDCVQNCTFCFRIMGEHSESRGFRVRSPESFFKEIKYLIDEYGINELNLLDDMFAANKKRVIEFCEMIKPLKLKWQCQVRVNVVDDDLLKMMKDAGCYLISYGFESGSPTVLRSMSKGITPEQIERSIAASLRAKVSIQGNFIFGDPAETIETMNQTIEFTRKYKSIFLGFGLVKPYPGSALYNKLVAEGRMKDEEKVRFYQNPLLPINLTTLSDNDFKYLSRRIVFESIYRNHFSYGKLLKLEKMGRNLYQLAIRCQHCHTKNRATMNIYFKDSRKNVNLLVCYSCYQKILINVHSLRFGNILRSIYYLGYFYALKFVTLRPKLNFRGWFSRGLKNSQINSCNSLYNKRLCGTVPKEGDECGSREF